MTILTDDQNTDDQNTDDQNTDDQNTDDQNTDDQNTDDQNTDDQNTDDQNTDDQNAAGSAEGEQSWLDGLSDELKGNERISSFKSMEEALNAFAKADLAEVVPEKYEFPEGSPDWLQDWAKKGKYSQAQVNGMLMLKSGIDQQTVKQIGEVNQRGLDTLYSEWGEGKDLNISTAKQALAYMDKSGELAKLLTDPFIQAGNNPHVIEGLYRAGLALKEGGFVKGVLPKTTAQGKTQADRMFPSHEKSKE